MFTEPESFNADSLKKYFAENTTLETLYLEGAHKKEDFIFRYMIDNILGIPVGSIAFYEAITFEQYRLLDLLMTIK